MQIRKYDGKCVRITLPNGEVYEGVCRYNSVDYNEHEFGRSEDALQIVNFLFYRSDIKKIECLETHWGPYGHFSAPFGLLEEWNVREGFGFIQDVIESEEGEHVPRMLCCLDSFLERGELRAEDVIPAVKEIPSFYSDPEILAAGERFLQKWG